MRSVPAAHVHALIFWLFSGDKYTGHFDSLRADRRAGFGVYSWQNGDECMSARQRCALCNFFLNGHVVNLVMSFILILQTSASGDPGSCMGKVFFRGPTATDTRGYAHCVAAVVRCCHHLTLPSLRCGRKARCTDTAPRPWQMVMRILAIGRTTAPTAKASKSSLCKLVCAA